MPGELGDVLGPECPEDLDVLLGPRGAIVPRDVARLELLGAPPDSDAQIDASAREPVERRDMLGGVHGVALREEHHAGAQADALGVRGQERVRDERVRQRRRRREERLAVVRPLVLVGEVVEQHDMLPEEQLGEPEFLGAPRELREECRVGLGVRRRKVQSDLHELSSRSPLRTTCGSVGIAAYAVPTEVTVPASVTSAVPS